MEEKKIKELVKKHEEHKLSGINLVASENRISPYAAEILASDLAGRYGNEWYGGSKYAMEIYETVERLVKKLFKAKYAFITPLSGNICDVAAILAFSNFGDEVAGMPKENGGYPFGYEKFGRKFYPLPMKEYFIDEDEIGNINKDFPLLMLASSTILFPHPVEKIAKEFKGVLCYDASHVLGLIAGGAFQKPLKEGAKLMIASTHKSFPGPQGGIVIANDAEIAEKIAPYLLFDFDKGIGLIDNPHMNRIAALGAVIEEMIEGGEEYASQIVKNAKYLARCLDDLGVPVKYKHRGYTESHQILLNMDKKEAYDYFKKLERNSIFIDCVGRIGVAEATHVGMKEEEMEEIAHMMAEVYDGKEVGEKASKLAMEFYL